MAKKAAKKAKTKSAPKKKQPASKAAKKKVSKATGKSAKKSTGKSAAKKKASKSPAKKTVAKKAVKKTTAKKSTAKKVAGKVAKKAPTKKAPPKKATKKKVAKKAPAKKTTAKTATSSAADDITTPTVLTSPSYKGSPQKLPSKDFPKGTGGADFRCYGPPATTDGAFENVRICDMGCFTQDGKDSNKYYHGSVVQDKNTDNWYAYFEWGRTGASFPSFQFVACESEADARDVFARQLHAKNDKRGEWVTIANIRALRAKKGKDCYLVRPQAARSTGLPDAKSIKSNEGAKEQPKKKSTKKKSINVDPQTHSLMKDLAIATIAYTRGSMADSSLPTQVAIDDARNILAEAQERLIKVGDEVKRQVKDKKVMQLTTLMYSRIPKRKPVGAEATTWILSTDNILTWQNDLDAFESALYSSDIEHEIDDDPFAGMKISMEWISPDSNDGQFLYNWWPKATGNRHSYIGKMKIRNLWRVDRHDDAGKIPKAQKTILADKPKVKERPEYQPKARLDLSTKERKVFKDSNTGLLFHGTRSVNVSGILREALRLPKQLVGVVITGAMFGPGLYFADDWKKSAGYTSIHSSYWAGGSGVVKGRDAFMFAADTVLGEPFVAPSWGGYTEPPKGHHCIYGKSGTSGVQNNEFIVFNPDQNRLRYLIEFTTT